MLSQKDDTSISIAESSGSGNSEVGNLEPCISKVDVGFRRVKPEAYEPVLVSIGPYHKAKPNLQAMQQNKNSYMDLLLKRIKNCKTNLAKLAKFDDEARKCYVDPVNCNDEFADMMLLDGCFIVEFLRKMDNEVNGVEFDSNDPIHREPWMKNRIQCDLMLLENQLPYHILSTFHEITRSAGEKSLEEMVMSVFNIMLPRRRLNSNNVLGNNGAMRINHLLHLVHVFCHPKNPTRSTVQTMSGNNESSGDQTYRPLLLQNDDSGSANSYEMKNQMRTVVELQEAGIKFKKVGKIYDGTLIRETEDNYVSLFDIDFESGVMKVPCFRVDHNTETLLRNLIAYEQHFANVCLKYFTDFACLMNQLINSKEDAKVLRFEEIIVNFLGDDDELSQLFNRLTGNVSESYEPYDHKVRQNVDKHCKTKCNVLMAKLRRDYFNNPWASISTFAAAVLLLLAVGQFVISLYNLLA